nr:hypothetical protein [uncultured Agathobaculum sp.]
MQNPNKFPHRCCTHYNEKGYDDGYVMPPTSITSCRTTATGRNS